MMDESNTAKKILIVDDDLGTSRTLSLILQKKGFRTEIFKSGQELLEGIKTNSYHVAILDLKLPDVEGTDLIVPIKKHNPDCAVIMVTGFASLETSIKAMNEGASSYITKPVNMDEVLAKIKDVLEKQDLVVGKRLAEIELRHTIEQLQKAMDGIIQAMAFTLEARDPYTAGHQKRVASIAFAIGQEIGLEQDRLEGLRMAAIIHDIGKINVPAEILTKPGRLTALEFEMIKTHSQVGYDILKDIEFPYPVAQIVLQHHEKLDGSGYPQGLVEKDILKEAKILTVADVLEAMSSHRPYRPALGAKKTLAYIEENKGILFDPEAVEASVRLVTKAGFCIENICPEEKPQGSAA